MPSSEQEAALSSYPLSSLLPRFLCPAQSRVAFPAFASHDGLGERGGTPPPLASPNEEGSFRLFLPQDGAPGVADGPRPPGGPDVSSPLAPEATHLASLPGLTCRL